MKCLRREALRIGIRYLHIDFSGAGAPFGASLHWRAQRAQNESRRSRRHREKCMKSKAEERLFIGQEAKAHARGSERGYWAALVNDENFLATDLIVGRSYAYDSFQGRSRPSSATFPQLLDDSFSFNLPRGWGPGDYDLAIDHEHGERIRFSYSIAYETKDGGIHISGGYASSGVLHLERFDVEK